MVGSGIAGLTAALHARAAGATRSPSSPRSHVDDGSTRWAQGGIAAALDPADSPGRAPGRHARRRRRALRRGRPCGCWSTEGPDRLRELIARGAAVRHATPDGSLALTREGGHHRNRIAHAGGDATGAEVQRALDEAVARDPGIDAWSSTRWCSTCSRGADGRAAGVTLHVIGEGSADGVGAVLARAVVLATGGMGQVFAATTNPAVSTGDGVALALRAGAVVTDLEFVQFHPTVLGSAPARAASSRWSARRSGARARSWSTPPASRFMQGVHELADLAPRDVVAKAILRVMQADGRRPRLRWTPARSGAELLAAPVPDDPGRAAAQAGIDPVTEPIPVVPAAHYASGGVRTDLHGRTSVPGLYACGEVACTGVHGANRLASNCLLEGLVFAGRIAADLARELPPQAEPGAGRRARPAWSTRPAGPSCRGRCPPAPA